MRIFWRFASDRAGAAVIEFALLAPVALAMLFALIEVGRAYWIKQTLNDVAYATARCMSVASTCDTNARQKNYALERARDLAVILYESDVTVVEATTCKGVPGANMVSVTHQFVSPIKGFLPFLPAEISATACFPLLT